MNQRLRIHQTIAILLLIVALASCKKSFLERPPISSITDANFYKTDDQVMAATSLLYNKVWFSYNDKASFSLGDIRGGTVFYPWGGDFRAHVLFTATGDNGHISAAWNAFFTVVAQANLFLYNIERYGGEAVSPQVKKAAIAEARYMRALAYRYLVMNWGAVPIIENNFEKLYDTTITRNTIPSIWRFLTREMKMAAADLPETTTQEGRLTKWSAEGMLARFYLTRAGVEGSGGSRNQQFLDSAKYYAERVITLSGRQLLPNYADLFKYPYDNNRESLFELQWVFTGGTGTYGLGNSVIDQISPNTDMALNGWGGGYSATYWLLSQYDGFTKMSEDSMKGRTLDQRLKATFLLPGSSYPEIIAKATGTGYVHPFASSDGQNPASIKKYMVGASNLVGLSAQQNYPQNTYMQRLAEMYLIYAEAVIGNSGSTTDAQAIAHFNAVHTRAGLPPYEVDGLGARGPLTLDEVYSERFKEFAVEGMAWYDIISLQYWNPTRAYQLINDQDRGLFLVRPNVMPNPSEWTIVKTSWFTERKAVVGSGNFYLPIPNTELNQAPNLQKPPVDYP
ncbi:RagB/SusD family nutrient uptake outer membrane protein [Niabella insulamsoli]|uniref:RagB/SusD family nutrient uptake outer membrane protein n=1 Tax=Niabella insulamsoli TaxID=3144874 RepID=UPI0031FC1C8F